MELIILTFVGLAAAGLFVWFVGLEQRGDRHTILLALLAVVIVEAVLAGHAANVPVGILRPTLAGQDFRPPDAVLGAALSARFITVRRGGEMSMPRLLWLGFFVWYLTGVAIGLMNGFPAQDVLFQGKAVFYIFGGIVVGSGVDFNRFARSIPRWVIGLAGITAVALAFEVIGFSISFSTPVQRFHGLGRLSNDTISLLTIFGALALLIEAVTKNRRYLVGLSGVILLFSPVVGQQRASYLVMGALGLGIALVSFGPTWRRRAHVTGTEVGLLFSAVLAVLVTGFLITASPGVITSRVEDAFAGEAEARSAAARLSLLDQAADRIKERPIMGWGVGVKVTRQAVESKRQVEAAAHNVILDLTMRSGVVGIALFAAAVGATLLTALRRWQSAPSTVAATIVLAAGLAVVAILTKGMVEPALDKFRLSTALGIAVGIVLSTNADRKPEDVDTEQDDTDVGYPVTTSE